MLIKSSLTPSSVEAKPCISNTALKKTESVWEENVFGWSITLRKVNTCGTQFITNLICYNWIIRVTSFSIIVDLHRFCTSQFSSSLQQLLFKISPNMHWYKIRIREHNHFPYKPAGIMTAMFMSIIIIIIIIISSAAARTHSQTGVFCFRRPTGELRGHSLVSSDFLCIFSHTYWQSTEYSCACTVSLGI